MNSRLLQLLITIPFLTSFNGATAWAAEPTTTDPPPKVLPAAPEHDLVAQVCTGCHVPETVVAKRHTAEEWDDIIARMVDHGAMATDAQQDQILAYLVRFYGKSLGQ